MTSFIVIFLESLGKTGLLNLVASDTKSLVSLFKD